LIRPLVGKHVVVVGTKKEKRGTICLPVEQQPMRISSDNTQPLPIPPTKQSHKKKSPPRMSNGLFAKIPKPSAPKRTKDIISSPRTVAVYKRPHHNINSNEPSENISSSKKKRRTSSVEQQQRKAPDIKHHNLNYNENSKKVSSSKKIGRHSSVEQQQRKASDIKHHNLNSNENSIKVSSSKKIGRHSSVEQQQRKAPDIKHHNLNSNDTSKKVSSSKKLRRTNSVEQQQRKAPDIKLANHHEVESNTGRRKGAVSRTCPLCKRVFHMSKVSLAEVASHISRCCDANFPIRKQVIKEPKKPRFVPSDDAIEVSRRKESLQFLRGGLAKRTLEDIALCYLSSI